MTDVELSPGGVGFIRTAAVKPNVPTSPARAAWAKGQAVEDESEGRPHVPIAIHKP